MLPLKWCRSPCSLPPSPERQHPAAAPLSETGITSTAPSSKQPHLNPASSSTNSPRSAQHPSRAPRGTLPPRPSVSAVAQSFPLLPDRGTLDEGWRYLVQCPSTWVCLMLSVTTTRLCYSKDDVSFSHLLASRSRADSLTAGTAGLHWLVQALHWAFHCDMSSAPTGDSEALQCTCYWPGVLDGKAETPPLLTL